MDFAFLNLRELTVNGKYIDIKADDGGSFRAYVAEPARGSGPGIILLQEIFGINDYIREVADQYAEEGYVVVAPDLFWRMEPGIELGYSEDDFGKAFGYYEQFDVPQAIVDITTTVGAMRSLPNLKGGIGALGFCLGGKLAYLAAAHSGVDVAVGYYAVGVETDIDLADKISCPIALHLAEDDELCPAEAQQLIKETFAGRDNADMYSYPGVGHAFGAPARPSYNKAATLMAHSRSIKKFRETIGPIFDLNNLWDMHCFYEFAERDVPKTMATMVDEPYVNHIPTMTGGVGQKMLARFYQHHFVNSNPADTSLIPISRTIGADRVVDEMLFCFTHDVEIDWMLPGVAPTGKYVEIPLVAIVCFRGDKLYNEHIYWDQASVLVQIGLLDASDLPIAGVETAKKLLDESLPSNEKMARWASSENA